jgi:hypothetical protein
MMKLKGSVLSVLFVLLTVVPIRLSNANDDLKFKRTDSLITVDNPDDCNSLRINFPPFEPKCPDNSKNDNCRY